MRLFSAEPTRQAALHGAQPGEALGVDRAPRRRTALGLPRPRLGYGLLSLPAIVYVGLVFVWPVARLLVSSLAQGDDPLRNFRRVLSTPLYLETLLRTFEFSAYATVGSLVLGYPLAYRLRMASGRGRLLLIGLVVVPFFVALMVRTFGWMVILGSTGPVAKLFERLIGAPVRVLYTPLAVEIGMVAILLPFMVMPIYSVMSTIDLRLTRSAQMMGASPVSAFLTVFFPLTFPGILAGVVLVFMLGIGFFITPDLLGSNKGTVYAMLLVNSRRSFQGSPGFVEAMAVVLLVATLLILALSTRLIPLDRVWGGATRLAAPLPRAETDTPSAGYGRLAAMWAVGGRAVADYLVWPSVRLLGRLPVKVARVPGLVVAALAIGVLDVPILVAVVISFGEDMFLGFPPQRLTLDWYVKFLQTSYWMDALVTSLELGLLTAVLTSAIGWLTALALVRARLRGNGLVISLLLSPIIIPQVISGLAIYSVFFPIGLVGTIPGLVLAHGLTALPTVTIIMAANLQSFDVRLEKAARVLGASALQAFWHVTFPLLRPGIIAAAFFGFLGSFDDLTYSLFLVGTDIRTLPIRLWEDLHFKLSPVLAVVSVVEIVVVTAVLVLAGLLMQGRSRARAAR